MCRWLLAKRAARRAARRLVNDQLAHDDQTLGNQLDTWDRPKSRETDR